MLWKSYRLRLLDSQDNLAIGIVLSSIPCWELLNYLILDYYCYYSIGILLRLFSNPQKGVAPGADLWSSPLVLFCLQCREVSRLGCPTYSLLWPPMVHAMGRHIRGFGIIPTATFFAFRTVRSLWMCAIHPLRPRTISTSVINYLIRPRNHHHHLLFLKKRAVVSKSIFQVKRALVRVLYNYCCVLFLWYHNSQTKTN